MNLPAFKFPYSMEKLRLTYSRLTLTRFTTCLFLVSLSHGLLQIATQSYAHRINRQATELTSQIMETANMTNQFTAVAPDGSLQVCTGVPDHTGRYSCQTMFAGVQNNVDNDFDGLIAGDVAAGRNTDISYITRRETFVTPVYSTTSGHLEGVNVSGIGPGGTSALVSLQCASVLCFANQTVRDESLEAVVMIVFQCWVFVMTIIAILQQSIPHIFAVFTTNLLATIWAAFKFVRQQQFTANFHRIVVNGSCGGLDVLPTYWRSMDVSLMVILLLNALTFPITFYLGISLIRTYGHHAFKRVGTSVSMARIYKLVLTLSTTIQLATFFLIASIGLWVDQMCSGPLARFATHPMTFRAVYIFAFVLLPPWLWMGWVAVRRERRKMMFAFLLLSAVYIGLWSALFASFVYRWTFATWPFFAVLSVAAIALTSGVFVLGVACRTNFHKGLAHYLRVQEILEEANFTPGIFEHDIGKPDKTGGPTKLLKSGGGKHASNLSDSSFFSPIIRRGTGNRGARGSVTGQSGAVVDKVGDVILPPAMVGVTTPWPPRKASLTALEVDGHRRVGSNGGDNIDRRSMTKKAVRWDSAPVTVVPPAPMDDESRSSSPTSTYSSDLPSLPAPLSRLPHGPPTTRPPPGLPPVPPTAYVPNAAPTIDTQAFRVASFSSFMFPPSDMMLLPSSVGSNGSSTILGGAGGGEAAVSEGDSPMVSEFDIKGKKKRRSVLRKPAKAAKGGGGGKGRAAGPHWV